MTRRIPRIVLNLAVFLATAMATAAGFELFLLGSEVSLPPITENHPRLGRSFKPHARIFLAEEGLYLGSVNRFGYLGQGYPPERRTPSLRIAILGDSYVEAFQLFERHNFITRLRQELEASLDVPVEVLNFGRSGLNLGDMVVLAEEMVRQYDPDLILFVVSDGDFRESSRVRGPRCVLEDGELRVSFAFVESAAYQASQARDPIKHFATFGLLQKANVRRREGHTWSIVLDKLDPSPARASGAQPQADAHRELNDAVLQRLGEWHRNRTARIALVQKGELSDHSLRAIDRAGVLRADVQPALQQLRDQGVDPYYWPATRQRGHWNHAGHAVVGQALAQAVEEWLQDGVLYPRRTDPR